MQLWPEGHVTSPRGFLAAGAKAGIKPSGRPDLAIILSDRPAVAAGVFTTNLVHAYNVARNRRLLKAGHPLRAIVVSSGNANVATGSQGIADTEEMASLTATTLGLRADEVAIAQTGVIGVKLPMERVREHLPPACRALDADGGLAAAEAICTTDTHLKHRAAEVQLGGVPVRVGAIAKGAGMIHPNMATLLCFVTTDAAVAPDVLQALLARAVDQTLNCLTIDGDQSTSDTTLVLANGAAGNPLVTSADSADGQALLGALTAVLDPLAAAIARDGEGASKLLTIRVRGARDASQARLAARAVAGSSLFKCAARGNDPNWGRIACAVGYSGAEVAADRLHVALNDVPLMVAGEPCEFDGRQVSASMAAGVTVDIDLALGSGEGHAYGCDLTEDYVAFNAEYTT